MWGNSWIFWIGWIWTNRNYAGDFGADQFDQGAVYINGNIKEFKSPNDAICQGIGFLPEDRKSQGLTLEMSVKENVNLASYKDISKLGMINLAKEKKHASDYVKKLRVVTPGINQKVSNLSGGNQQKVVLGKWLCKNSSIFILMNQLLVLMLVLNGKSINCLKNYLMPEMQSSLFRLTFLKSWE